MASTIRWGVLGAAAIATGRTMPAIQAAPSATLLALASRDLAKGRRVAAELGIPHVHASYEALLADPAIDAVYVPLPNQLHFEWALKALQAGKHVLCEKPLCISAEQVRQLCAERDRSGKHIEEGFAFRNHPQWAKLDEVIAAGTLGDVRSVHATLAKQFLDPADVRNNPDAGGGALYDLGSYAISACNLVFKRAPARVVATLDRDPNFRIDRLSSALLDYGDRHAAFTVGTQAGSDAWGTHQQFSVLGSRGWLRMNFAFAHARPTASQLEVGDASSVGAFPTTTYTFEPANHYLLQVERFSRLLLGDKVPSWPIEDALDTMRTIEALFTSARQDSWQDVAR
ncbi:Gfo/Idh/MocA family oxidoreductase [Ramlibacter sp. G-1-2-2]|uniref:Gfo/Idh/MocA family oxidoreductase n=1 Tax=Ramlibacter agri TaxID=2728837 RepID=A0A848GWX5_9BURK|nr:Gfo/Idh/MocA family oxidoreductase [Ramlibacter agri]NML42647.1 Gfo/Idh/MocA family oxidoreductase [Ramlibacter agri]